VAEESDFFFVADGYCNSRIFKFNKDGNLIKIIGEIKPYFLVMKQLEIALLLRTFFNEELTLWQYFST